MMNKDDLKSEFVIGDRVKVWFSSSTLPHNGTIISAPKRELGKYPRYLVQLDDGSRFTATSKSMEKL